MESISEHLVVLATRLDSEGKLACANAVDNLIKTASLEKVAQYVGVIGYVLKQNRAMGNCIRKKRAASDSSMQDIVLNCLKEYQDGQDYQDDQWASKYAQVIEQVPDQFDEAHMALIAEITESNELKEAIASINDTQNQLKDSGESDELIDAVLANLNSLGDVLRKEGSSYCPFRLASLPPQKKWWQKLFSPTEKKWWTPKSWVDRGEDQQTEAEMGAILQNIIEIETTTRRMRDGIYNLQQGISPALVDARGGQYLQQQIAKLNPKDWRQTALIVEDLSQHIENVDMLGEDALSTAGQVSAQLASSVQSVNQDVSDLQEIMSNMRKRSTIRGKDLGFTRDQSGQVQQNPMAISPTHEFAILEQILNRLYQNPFDQRAHTYAKRAHARLDDKLRYISQEDDPEMSDYLRTEEEMPSPPPEEPQSAPAVEQTPFDQKSIDGLVEFYKKMDFDLDTIASLIYPMVALIRSKDPQAADYITNSLQKIDQERKDKQKLQTESPKTPQPQTTSPPKPPVKTPTKRPQPQATSAPAEDVDPSTEYADDIARNMQGIREFIDRDIRRSSTIKMLLKLADVADEVDADLGNIVDKYIEERVQDVSLLPSFPEFGVLVKEDIKSRNCAGIKKKKDT